ncbi:hypothetical protein J2W42_000078 [Rhizobium tibeticum]|nr:hypothetical protein [Rhizobium tibeticum]
MLLTGFPIPYPYECLPSCLSSSTVMGTFGELNRAEFSG